MFNRSDALTYAGVISGTGSVTQAGAGTLTLTGTSTYTGTTTVNGGTLQVGNGGTTGSVAGTLGVNLTNGGSVAFYRSGSVTFSANIDGAGSVTQAGGGVLTLSGTNTYTGGTQLRAGTLELGSADALGPTGIVLFSGGTLRFTATNTTDYSARVGTTANQAFNIDTNGQDVAFASALTSSGGTLTKLGAGTLTLAGANT